MAIKVLEQQSCEDYISRQAVLSYICNDLEFGDEENGCNLERKIAQEEIYNFIKKIPPVTPKEKTGKWINLRFAPPVFNGSLSSLYATCSNCNKESWFPDKVKSKYCPNCGARMVSE